jgi:NADPH:quinone reductase
LTLRAYNGIAERGITFHPIDVHVYGREQAKLDRLRQRVEDGLVTQRVARTMPIEQAARSSPDPGRRRRSRSDHPRTLPGAPP